MWPVAVIGYNMFVQPAVRTVKVKTIQSSLYYTFMKSTSRTLCEDSQLAYNSKVNKKCVKRKSNMSTEQYLKGCCLEMQFETLKCHSETIIV